MFSIIIPLYNKESYIEKTLNTVLNQTVSQFEVILIDDGSTDNSLEKVKLFKDSRINLIQVKHAGVSTARNIGIEQANYSWIVFLDADDQWLPYHLEDLQRAIERFPTYWVFCTNFNLKYKYKSVQSVPDIHFGDNDAMKFSIKSRMNTLNFPQHTSSMCINKSVFSKVGLFDINLNRCEDMDLWIRIGLFYDLIFLRRVSAIFDRNVPHSLTQRDLSTDSITLYMETMSKHRTHDMAAQGLSDYLNYNFTVLCALSFSNFSRIECEKVLNQNMPYITLRTRYLIKGMIILNSLGLLKVVLNFKSFVKKIYFRKSEYLTFIDPD